MATVKKSTAKKRPSKKTVVKNVAAPAPKKLVNNVIFVIDDSSSMDIHRRGVKQFMEKIQGSLSQSGFSTRVSLYKFSDRVSKLEFMNSDINCLSRFTLGTGGMTALVDASATAIKDHQNDFLVSKKDEDNTFLLYVITDGGENASRQYRSNDLRDLIASLDDSWTMATMVPNLQGVHAAKNCGFSAGNIEIWDTTSQAGFERAADRVAETYTAYSNLRSSGVRSTQGLFTVNAANISRQDVKSALVEGQGRLIRCQKASPIRDFVEQATGESYKIGSAFYELTKREKVQPQKEVAIVSGDGKKKYFGDAARQMLGLNVGGLIKVAPGDHGDWRIFIQSTSVNRKVVPGQSILLKA